MYKTILFDSELLEQIWAALHKPVPVAYPAKATQMFSRFIKTGWAQYADVTDLLDCLDSRLANGGFDLQDIIQRLGFNWQDCFFRPKSYSSSVFSNTALRVDELCGLLMKLERLGFNIDAGPFVAALKQQIGKTALLSAHETDLFFYKAEKGKTCPVVLSASENLMGYWTQDTESIKTISGYKVIRYAPGGSVINALEFIAPRYKRRIEPVPVTCEVCGYEWRKGDKESSYGHRLEHRRRLKYLDPQPSENYMNAKQNGPGARFVDCNSELWKHQEVYLRARAFRREFHYDFIQWSTPGKRRDSGEEAYILTTDQGVIAGVVAFQSRAGSTPAGHYWGLKWVWIAPKYRRQGLLSNSWDLLRARYGDFYVEPPVSDAMQGFLGKRGDLHLLHEPAVDSDAGK